MSPRVPHPLARQAPRSWGTVLRRLAEARVVRELEARAQAAEHLLPFVHLFNPNYIDSEFTTVLAEKLDKFIRDCEAGLSPRLMIFAPPRHGKALARGTLVPTIHGMEKVENLRVGDMVIGSDGRPTAVVAVHDWTDRPRYRVTTDDGHSVVVDAQHEWEVRLDRKGGALTVRTTEWLAARTSPRKPMIRMVRTVGAHRKLPVPPYTLGCWLGDGTSAGGSITQAAADMEHLRLGIEAEGFVVRAQNSAYGHGVLGLKARLAAAGLLKNKHIPEVYFVASVAQRMALLRGLIDTDGYVAGDGQVEFCSVNERLARGVARLVHSLGVKASVILGRATVNAKDCGPKYRVMFYMAGCCTLPRKASRTKDGVKQPGRYLSFERVEDGPTRCIQVAAEDHLYLCTDACILTHNSELVSRALPALYLGRNPHHEVISAAATGELADEFGLFVRNALNDPLFHDLFPRCQLDDSSNAVSRLTTRLRGGYRGLGVNMQIVGRGAHLLILDDPVSGRAAAYSELERTKLYAWYRTNARTRVAPGGGILVMHQRWHVNDLAGTLLAQAAADKDADQWEVLAFPAIAEDSTNDGLDRNPGQVLVPERWPLPALRSLRAGMTDEEWLALFQQRPVRESGGFFKAEWLQYHSEIPKNVYWYIGADFAGTANTHSNRTALLPYAISETGDMYLAPDFVLERMEIPDAVDKLVELIVKYKPRFVAGEKGTLQNVVNVLLKPILRKRRIYGTSIREVTRSSGKHIVAATFQARMQHRQVWLPSTQPVRSLVVPSLLNFIAGADNDDDDFIDASANLCCELDTETTPAPPPELPELDDSDDAIWERIMSNGAPPSAAPFTRFNGEAYSLATTPKR
jgi:hypothetical protein